MSILLSVGDPVAINTSKLDNNINNKSLQVAELIGLIRYIGFIHGQKHMMKQYVGIELIQPINNGHNGTIYSYQYFSAPEGYGVHLPITDIARKLTAEEITLKLRNVINLNNLFKNKLDQYLKALTERDEYIENLKQKQKHLKSVLSQTNDILKQQQMFQKQQPLSITNNISLSVSKETESAPKTIDVTAVNDHHETSTNSSNIPPITPMTPATALGTVAFGTAMHRMMVTSTAAGNNTVPVLSQSDSTSYASNSCSTTNSQTINTSTTFTSTKTAAAAVLQVINDEKEVEDNKGSGTKPQKINVYPQNISPIAKYVSSHSSPAQSQPISTIDANYNMQYIQQQQQRNVYSAQNTPPSMHYKYQSILSPIQYQIVSPSHYQIPFFQPIQAQAPVLQQEKQRTDEQYQTPKHLQQSVSSEWRSDMLANSGFVISNEYIYDAL